MEKCRFSMFLVLLMLSTGVSVAQVEIDHFEFGLQGGAGVYVCNPMKNATRPHRTSLGFYDPEGESISGNFPMADQYGAFIRYRFDNHWNVTVEATRQRVRFQENKEETIRYYYNAMWHVDAVAEYNILSYGTTSNWGAELENYAATPYVVLGVGVTAYNKDAAYAMRSFYDGHKDRKANQYPNMITQYNREGNKQKQRPTGALYVPIGLGVKWRLNQSLQLQASIKYHFYLLNGNLEGGTPEWTYEDMIANKEHTKLGKTHNALFSLGIVYNLSWSNNSHNVSRRAIKWED